MKVLKIGGADYELTFSFESATHKNTVQNMFKVLSGSYFLKNGIGVTESVDNSKENMLNAMIDGSAEMVAELPHIVKGAFYAGLLEKHPMPEEEAYSLMKEYMKENKISYRKLFEEIKECMENDGFFDLSGLTEMLQEMNETPKKKATKTPQDHKKATTAKK